ncbi:hypothetical protein AC71_2488 [Escherichia coli 2-222-05_S4_C1]|nr:hypothetical protein AD26_2565 [Escherichia coli 2-156-04_S4_C3]KEM90009.1 hypothetical protein AC71_2488 [Escherichia coli 2-222-05_S4_C1]
MAASVISPLTGLGCFAVLPLIGESGDYFSSLPGISFSSFK